jgi:hypothetical protein
MSSGIDGRRPLTSVSDRIRRAARDYDLSARAAADRPDADSRLSAIALAAVSIALTEIADAIEHDPDELEAREAA